MSSSVFTGQCQVALLWLHLGFCHGQSEMFMQTKAGGVVLLIVWCISAIAVGFVISLLVNRYCRNDEIEQPQRLLAAEGSSDKGGSTRTSIMKPETLKALAKIYGEDVGKDNVSTAVTKDTIVTDEVLRHMAPAPKNNRPVRFSVEFRDERRTSAETEFGAVSRTSAESVEAAVVMEMPPSVGSDQSSEDFARRSLGDGSACESDITLLP